MAGKYLGAVDLTAATIAQIGGGGGGGGGNSPPSLFSSGGGLVGSLTASIPALNDAFLFQARGTLDAAAVGVHFIQVFDRNTPPSPGISARFSHAVNPGETIDISMILAGQQFTNGVAVGISSSPTQFQFPAIINIGKLSFRVLFVPQ